MIIGPLTTAMLVGVCAALCWLLWFTGLLLVVLVVVQAVRSDVTVAPQMLLAIAASLFAVGWLCRWISKRIEAISNR